VLTYVAGILALHMGALHPAEKALTIALAFGPFVLLGIVIAVRRRQDRIAEKAEEAEEAERRRSEDAGQP
jgi:cytochrome c-type biogenesis protein CcmH/NrfF